MTTADFTADELATLARFDATPAAPESWGGVAADSALRDELDSLFLKHQRPGIGVCTCGGMRLGESYPQHLADAALAVFAAHLGQQQAEARADELQQAAEEWRWNAPVFQMLRDRAARIRAALGADL